MYGADGVQLILTTTGAAAVLILTLALLFHCQQKRKLENLRHTVVPKLLNQLEGYCDSLSLPPTIKDENRVITIPVYGPAKDIISLASALSEKVTLLLQAWIACGSPKQPKLRKILGRLETLETRLSRVSTVKVGRGDLGSIIADIRAVIDIAEYRHMREGRSGSHTHTELRRLFKWQTSLRVARKIPGLQF